MSEQNILPNMSEGEISINKTEKQIVQKDCNVLPLSDSKNVVSTTTITNDDNIKEHQVLEGEACVILNSNNQS